MKKDRAEGAAPYGQGQGQEQGAWGVAPGAVPPDQVGAYGQGVPPGPSPYGADPYSAGPYDAGPYGASVAPGMGGDPGLYGSGGPRDATLDAFVSGAAYAALGLLGALLGLVGSFAQGWTIGSIPVAAIVLVLVNFAIARAAGWAMGGRTGAAVPVLLWALVTLALSIGRTEGDLIVPGTLPGYLFIVGGLAAGVVAVSLVPAARPAGNWLTWRAPKPAVRPEPGDPPAPGRPPGSGSA
ncbi:DUF6113 family protein [Actinomadura rugatobispora]|uniref:DUF6113 family protein n=1 Tax=Actinomadura rugatobispora TaxID=1994 RepID=A0ABW1A1Y8_9ACTN